MRQGDVVNLAWDLADAVAPTVPRSRRVAIFAALGAGAASDVITSLLYECRRPPILLAPPLAARILVWIDGYADPRDRRKLETHVKHMTGLAVRPPVQLVAPRRSRLAVTKSNAWGRAIQPPI